MIEPIPGLATTTKWMGQELCFHFLVTTGIIVFLFPFNEFLLIPMQIHKITHIPLIKPTSIIVLSKASFHNLSFLCLGFIAYGRNLFRQPCCHTLPHLHSLLHLHSTLLFCLSHHTWEVSWCIVFFFFHFIFFLKR